MKVTISRAKWTETGIKAGWLVKNAAGGYGLVKTAQQEDYLMNWQGASEIPDWKSKSTSGEDRFSTFIVLYGEPGQGRGALVDMIAEETGRQVKDLDLAPAKGGMVGQTEDQVRNVISSLKSIKNSVVRLNGADLSPDSNVMKQLISFMDENTAMLRSNGVTVVVIAGNPGSIRGSMMDRSKAYPVPA